MNRRGLLVLFLAAFGLFSLPRPSQAAGRPRFFVIQSTGLFEVIDGAPGGGTFIRRPTSEYVFVPGLGNCRVMGLTDRASRGERVATCIPGSGVAQEIGVTISGVVRGRWYNVGLPITVPSNVSVNANDDNIVAYARQGGSTASRRLPIGRRP